MTYDRTVEEDEEGGIPSSILFNNDILRWQTQSTMDYHPHNHHPHHPNDSLMPLQAVVPSNSNPTTSTITTTNTTTAPATTTTTTATTTSPTTTAAPVPAINTTNPALAPPPPILDPTKQYHPEWGVIKDQDFHALTLKHQRDLENHFQTNNPIADFYFWQANLGGYCMADMVQGVVVSSEGAFVLERKIVEGAPHPGRRKKKRGLG